MFTTPGHAELRADIVTIVLGGPLAGMPQIAALEFARDEIHRTVHEELAAQGAGRCGVLLRFVRALRAVFDFGESTRRSSRLTWRWRSLPMTW